MGYKDIQANNGTISIGYIGDNLASRIIFDVSELLETYGSDGTFDLLIRQQSQRQRACGEYTIYPAEITTDMTEETVTWIPTAQDTSSGQYLDVELVYTIDEQVVYTQMYRCVCKKSLANHTQGNAPQPSWVTQVIQAGTSAKTSAESAEASALSASQSAETASTAATNAAQSETNAAGSATSAAQSAQAAQTAADSVTTATVAETQSYLGI